MKLFRFLGSIRCALILIACTALLVIAGTFIESRTESHRYAALFTYGSPFFAVLLALFFVNILFSTLRRWPFRRKHIPFLITHLGLLMLFAGAIIKTQYGLQGSMAILEGSGSDAIFLPDTYVISVENQHTKQQYKLRRNIFGTLLPSIKEKNESDLTIKLAAYYPNCRECWDSWIKGHALSLAGLPLIPIMETLTPFPVSVDRLWNVAALQAHDLKEAATQGWEYVTNTQIPLLLFLKDPQATVHLLAMTPEGQTHYEEFPTDKLTSLMAYNHGYSGYAMHASIPFLSMPLESPIKARHQVQPSAVKLEENTPRIILTFEENGQKDQISLAYDHYGSGIKWPVLDGKYLVRFQPEFISLPYRVRLRDARQIPYPSTSQPYSYESDLIVTEKTSGQSIEKTISMNHVHETHDGYRFYLANITPGEETAVQRAQLAVNYDPVKYWLTYPGAVIMTIGILLLFFFWPYKRTV